MNQQTSPKTTAASQAPALQQCIRRLALEASIEISVPDLEHLEASRALLPPGKRVYVSFLPKQSWQQSEQACIAVRAAGFEPVPHVPVRLLPDRATLERTLRLLVDRAAVAEVLLIAGDYAEANGPFACVADVLRSGVLEDAGLTRVSLAGHPEGHPRVTLGQIRQAEREKLHLAADAGLQPSLVTQFFFEARPFLDWVGELRAGGLAARIVAGVAGPARLATLFKFAMRCGVGPSLRALGARPGSLMKLIGDHGPEALVHDLARALCSGESDFAGIHLFCFGGYLRTCEWLAAVADGRFKLTAEGVAQA